MTAKPALPRLFAPDRTHDIASLSPEEAHHARHVLRLSAGDRVRVFDGVGGEWEAEVLPTSGGWSCRLTSAALPAPELSTRMTLAPAMLKEGHLDDVIRDGTMLGVAAFTPVLTGRTRSSPPVAHEAAHRRWTRIAIASAKQCGRAIVPHIDRPVAFGTLVRGAEHEVRTMLLEPGASSGLPAFRPETHANPPTSLAILVGPEGGWTPDEIAAAADAGWQGWRLGRRILRADAAGSAALAVLQYLWDREPCGQGRADR